MGDGTRELPWLTMVLATLLVVPALARPAARMWAIVFVAALALWLGLWTLPALWPGQRWLGERWNWSGSLLALSGTLWVGTILVRRGGLTWHEMGFTWAQQPDSIPPALGVASAALLMQMLLTISSGYAPAPVSPETWLYQTTLPGLVEETIFRGVLSGAARQSLLGPKPCARCATRMGRRGRDAWVRASAPSDCELAVGCIAARRAVPVAACAHRQSCVACVGAQQLERAGLHHRPIGAALWPRSGKPVRGLRVRLPNLSDCIRDAFCISYRTAIAIVARRRLQSQWPR